MNYYADGLIGGFYRFEIDHVGFALWMMVAHVGWTSEPDRYLRERWRSISAAADLLTRWKDPENGLQAPAQEDDQAEPTQTLHGAITTFGSLTLAARAAERLGEREALEKWGARANELREAIIRELWLEDEERFETDALASWNPGSAASGPTAWLVWPHTLLPLEDERVQAQLRYDLEAITPALELMSEGGAYFMKNTVSLALAWGRDPERRRYVEAFADQLASQATNTGHFGETMQVVITPEGRRARQQVSTPHLWEGILFYLTAMALEDPEAFFAFETVLPSPSFLDPIPSLSPFNDEEITEESEEEETEEDSDEEMLMSNQRGQDNCNQQRSPFSSCHFLLLVLFAFIYDRRMMFWVR